MTENQAKKIIKKFCGDRMDFVRGKDMSDKELEDFCKFSEALNLSISSLEEIQQYHSIGTVEDITKVAKFFSIDDNSIFDDLARLHKYYLIGTVEECLEARERQRAKKPVYPHLKSFPTCPNCGEVNLQQENEYGNVVANYDFCPDCGQAIDWSE